VPGLLPRCPRCAGELDVVLSVEVGGAAAPVLASSEPPPGLDEEPVNPVDDTLGAMETASIIVPVVVPSGPQPVPTVPEPRPAVTRQPRALGEQESLIGRLLDGRYTIRNKLGQGGMGTVYLGRQESMGRDVAIKVMRSVCAENDQQVARFMAEASTASQLRHPNTVIVHDFGQTEHGLLYLVMELLEGLPLSKLLKAEGALHWQRCLRIMIQVLGSLAEAHDKGFLHRDIKPDNIMVGRLGDNPDFAKVLDFGIAKSLGAANTGMTATGTVLGTPRYMSPEQATDRPVDGRADLYSLGVVLFEMLTGTPPFASETPVALLLKHVTEPPPDIRTTYPHVALPESLHRLLGSLLAKNPARRPADARVARRACEALLAEAAQTRQGPPAPLVVGDQPAGAEVAGDAAALGTPGPGRARRRRERGPASPEVVAVGGSELDIWTGDGPAIVPTAPEPRRAAVAPSGPWASAAAPSGLTTGVGAPPPTPVPDSAPAAAVPPAPVPAHAAERLWGELRRYLFEPLRESLALRADATTWLAVVRTMDPEAVLEELMGRATRLPARAARGLSGHLSSKVPAPERSLGRRLSRGLAQTLESPIEALGDEEGALIRRGRRYVTPALGATYVQHVHRQQYPPEGVPALPDGVDLSALLGSLPTSLLHADDRGAGLLTRYERALASLLDACDDLFVTVWDSVADGIEGAGGPSLPPGDDLRTLWQQASRDAQQAVLMAERGEREAASAAANRLAEQGPIDPGLLGLALNVAAAVNDKELCGVLCDDLAALAPDEPSLLLPRARGHVCLGESDEALRLLEGARAQLGDPFAARELLLRLLEDQGDVGPALKVVRDLCLDRPDDPALLLRRARLEARAGQGSVALRSLKKLAASPAFDETRLRELWDDPAFVSLRSDGRFEDLVGHSEGDMRRLARRHFATAGSGFYLGDEVPERKLGLAERKWLFLDTGEDLVFFIDTSGRADGSEGVALTETRLIWREGFAPPTMAPLAVLRPEFLRLVGAEIHVGTEILSLARHLRLADALYEMLQELARANE